MLELAEGLYTEPHSGLRYTLLQTLRLPPRSCLFLRGENGAGKSTFLEKILLPYFRKKHLSLYLAQDMDLQRTAMAATLAVLGIHAPESLAELARQWIMAAPRQELLFMDEFDKYLTEKELHSLNLPAFDWLIAVSHLSARAGQGFPHGFALQLSRRDKSVTLTLETLW